MWVPWFTRKTTTTSQGVYMDLYASPLLLVRFFYFYFLVWSLLTNTCFLPPLKLLLYSREKWILYVMLVFFFILKTITTKWVFAFNHKENNVYFETVKNMTLSERTRLTDKLTFVNWKPKQKSQYPFICITIFFLFSTSLFYLLNIFKYSRFTAYTFYN